ncbi:MAG: NlpC/P60 family protein [Actinomycetota bacterium]
MRTTDRLARASLIGVVALALAAVAAPGASARPVKPSTTTTTSTSTTTTSTTTVPTYTTRTLSAPSRVAVYRGTSWVATFTVGSRTVTLAGPARTFAEPANTTATVTGTTWVRLLSAPFTGTVDQTWLTARLSDLSPDVLALTMQYLVGGAPILDGAGVQIAGDAAYGPLQADGTRAEGSDFNDYLGVAWTYPSGTVDAPEADQFRALDCSGFMRMVLGYRSGVPLSLSSSGGTTLPRRSFEQEAAGPGITVIANTGVVPASLGALAPGDLVFFDASTDDGTQIDHVGMYLGVDDGGHPRFVSSRKTANGPTLGDLGGRSTLDGTGLYALAFRSARRV